MATVAVQIIEAWKSKACFKIQIVSISGIGRKETDFNTRIFQIPCMYSKRILEILFWLQTLARKLADSKIEVEILEENSQF